MGVSINVLRQVGLPRILCISFSEKKMKCFSIYQSWIESVCAGDAGRLFASGASLLYAGSREMGAFLLQKNKPISHSVRPSVSYESLTSNSLDGRSDWTLTRFFTWRIVVHVDDSNGGICSCDDHFVSLGREIQCKNTT